MRLGLDSFIRLMLSADLGAGDGGGGGVDAGAVDAGASAGVDAGASGGGEPVQDDAAVMEFVRSNGGLQGLQQRVQRDQWLETRMQHNPQFREAFEAALRGEKGPQAQQAAQNAVQNGQAPQQPGQGAASPMFKYDAQTVAALRTFELQLRQARQTGDEEAVQRIINDPMNKEVADKFFGHQRAMNDQWFNPREYQTNWFKDEEMKALRQAEYQQYFQSQMTPILERFEQRAWQSWYGQNKSAVDALPEHIRQALDQGVFGPVGKGRTADEWIAATQKAMEAARSIAAGGKGPVAGNATPQGGQPPRNGQPAKNGLANNGKPQKSEAEVEKEWADKMREARQKDAARQNL